MIIFGFGRMGRAVADALDTFGAAYTVVDMKPEATQDARLRERQACTAMPQ